MKPKQVIEMVAFIQGLWPAFKVTEGVRVSWVAAFEEASPQLAKAAILEIVQRRGDTYPPSVARIFEVMRELAAGSTATLTADQSWEMVKRSRGKTEVPEIVRDALRDCGGWSAWRMSSSENDFFRKRFTEAFERRRSSEIQRAAVDRVPVAIENNHNGSHDIRALLSEVTEARRAN